MIPVFQTIPAPQGIGNCLQACLASILEMPLEKVPHFLLEYDDNWFEEQNKFLLEHAGVYRQGLDYAPDLKPNGYSLLSGISPRGVMHCVVCLDGEMVHDPHPDGGGIVEPHSYSIFVSPMTAPKTSTRYNYILDMVDPDWNNPNRYD